VLLIASNGTPLFAAEKLELWPRAILSEQLTGNFQVSLINLIPPPQPPLFPFPPLLSPPPVTSKPPQLPRVKTSGKSEDAISLAGVGVSATLDSGSRTFGLDYFTEADLYLRNSRLDRALQDEYVGLRDEEQLSENAELSLSDTFMKGRPAFAQGLIGSYAASPLLDQALLQNNFLTNNFSAGLRKKLSERLTAVISGYQTFFSASGTETSASFQQGGDGTAYYAINPRFSLGPGFKFDDFRFSNQPRSDAFEPALAADWHRGKRFMTSAGVGPLILLSPAGSRMDFGYTLSTSYFGQRWLLKLDSGRRPSITAGLSGARISQFEGASAAYLLSRRTSAYINGSFNQFSGSGGTRGIAANIHIFAYSVGITHQLTPSLSLFGQFIRWQTNSPSITGNTIDTLNFGIKFSPEPWTWTF